MAQRPRAVAVGDFNTDGKPDLATANSGSNNVSVLYNCTTPANIAPTVVNPIPNQSATMGQAFSYAIPSNTFSHTQTPNVLTLSASGLPTGLSSNPATSIISGTPSLTGTSTVTITATDPGNLATSTTFTLTVNAGPVPPIPGTFAISSVTKNTCQLISIGKLSVIFTPQYAGVNGQPITFQAVNESLPTTNPAPYSLNLYTDNPVITLQAEQGGVVSNFSYNWLATCGRSARLGAGEPSAQLDGKVLRNPIRNGQVKVEVRGAAHQSLHLSLTNMQGQVISSCQIEQAGEVEEHRFDVSYQAAGVMLLRVNIPTQAQMVRLLKVD